VARWVFEDSIRTFWDSLRQDFPQQRPAETTAEIAGGYDYSRAEVGASRRRVGRKFMRDTIQTVSSVLASFSLLLLAGCAGVGPPTVARDRFDYVTTISDSWKRQTLQNLLKVRYNDAPVFMVVSAVISSYSLEGDISLGGQYAASGGAGNFGTVGATGRYSDKPTITYQPLTGDKFAKSLMAPIPVTGLLYLIQSGYPADVVMRFCVNTINGLDNAFGGGGNPRAGDPRFQELITLMRESQTVGGMGFRVKPVNDTQAVVMFMRPTNEQTARYSRKIGELLGLDASEREFSVLYGSFPATDREIAILTRSILQIMVDVASYVDVPATDIAEGRVSNPQRSAEQQRLFPPLIAVRQGASPPDDAFVAVPYRNGWFWIDDRDQRSKQILNFLMIMFSLTEGGPAQTAPIVTVPTR
jgi:hypothetical protein